MLTRSLRGSDVLRVDTTVEAPPGGAAATAKIKISANKPSTADRDLEIVLYVDSYSQSSKNLAYRTWVRLPEGVGQVEVELPLLGHAEQWFWDVGVFEGGRDIEDRRSRRGSNWMNANNTELAFAALISSQESPTDVADQLESLARSSYNSVPAQQAGSTTAYVFQVDTVSSDWRFFLARPFWFVSAAAVPEIAQRPELIHALQTYVASQGVLVVVGVQDATQLAQVDALLPAAKENAAEDSSGEPSWWTSDFIAEDGHLMAQAGTYLRPPVTTQGKPPLMRRFGFGSLLVTAASLQELDSDYWHQTLTDLLRNRQLSQENDGDWFWRNLIRSVGKPPVWMFCGLVTLFGGVLGPGVLFVTARIGRRSLMIFLVPAVSAVATVAIVAYGVLHEGFETHVRVTSVQTFDPSGHGFVWSRQNYFSGLPPREGLNFSPEAYVRSVDAETSSRPAWDGDPRRGVTATISLLDDRQNWSGWLGTRQQQQLLIGHPAKFEGLPIAIRRVGASEVEIRNTSSHTLPLVLLRGAGRDYYLAERLEPEQSVTVRENSRDVVRAKVAQLVVDYRPEAPPELGEGGSLLEFGAGARRYSTQVTLFETADIVNAQFKQALSDKLNLPPLGFAVLSTHSENVQVPLEGVSGEDLHLIIGTQTW